MKKLLFLFICCVGNICFAQQQNATFAINPATFNKNEEITITVSDINIDTWGVTDLYLWAWYFNSPTATNAIDSPTNGTWENSSENQKMINNGDGTHSITFIPTTLYNDTNITSIAMLVKAKDGSGDKKTQDNIVDVGKFQLSITSPNDFPVIINSGGSITINATTSVAADFVLSANDVIINSSNTAATTYNYTQNNITQNTTYKLAATNTGETITNEFNVFIKPTTVEEALPNGLVDGINLNTEDNTKATLVLYAPEKEFVHVKGDFNNWQINSAYLMKKDSNKDRFWIELDGLTPQTNHLYQYVVEYALSIADPYATLILDGYGNDTFIDEATFPNIPAYPAEQTEAITVLRTGDPEYIWQTTDFKRPEKTDLVIYELLIRDFDELHSFNATKNRLDYLQDLGINAIELMPVNEFDGNESWGYNPSFHMALDKYYGTKNNLKSFIDECHARGIAVILDVVYNHATGQHPYYRMWNTDNGGTGGQASDNNPFFNTTATHSYSVFNDFNHESIATRDYVKQTLSYWINEFKLDGMRWDLTKGFTQNCSSTDNSCTDKIQTDRIDILKEYADTQWALDSDFYVIFEHLGTLEEEEQWANYRIEEGKGILLWNKQTGPYNEATLGFHENNKSNFSGASYINKGFTQPSAISYMESHDEERLMYKNIEFGDTREDYDIKSLDTALSRMELAGAFFFSIPGPKMIWQFGELGYDISIDFNGRVGNKPIKWEYANETNRKAIYTIWSKLINLKINEPIFKTSDFQLQLEDTDGLKQIHLTDNNATDTAIKYVTIIGNFGITEQEINPNFQETGVWYEFLNGNLKYVVTDTQKNIILQPGEFRIFGNNPTSLFPNDNIPDDDSDGVRNEDDTCPNTPLGKTVDVNGCEIFSLAATNFSLKTQSETCKNSNNGTISITAVENYAYTATLSVSGTNETIKDFTSDVEFTNLGADTYTLCITLKEEPNYKQCFNVSISEPEDLLVNSNVDPLSKKLVLTLNGSNNYIINLNDTIITTSKNEITLDLNTTHNKLSVKTDKECQGMYTDIILLNNTTLLYPNPVKNNKLFIELQQISNANVEIEIYSNTGAFISSKKYAVKENHIEMDMSKLATGLYIVKIKTARETLNYKIMKS